MTRRLAEPLIALCTCLGVLFGASRLTAPALGALPQAPSQTTVADASGERLPRGSRRCIVSASTVSDRLVLELVGAEALCAVATPPTCERPWCVPLRGKPRVTTLDDLETLVRLAPDLVVTANPGAPARLMRLREAGLPVFDLGPSAGVASLEAATRSLGAVLAAEATAHAYWARFVRRMRTIAPHEGERPRALYLGLYGSTLVGGARDTSWHDVLEAAGLRDAAEDRSGWPSWSAVDVAERNPSVIVTEPGMASRLCGREGIAETEACRRGRIAEVDADLLGDPGPTMLEAAEALANRIAELSERR